jgi:hypothetical protein
MKMILNEDELKAFQKDREAHVPRKHANFKNLSILNGR